MYVTDKDAAFVGLAVAASGGHDAAVFLDELVNFGAAEDRASVAFDVVGE
jgi:hypothetical protein